LDARLAMPRAQKLALIAVALLLFSIIIQVPRAESSTNGSEEKALSFLSDVLEFDTSKYAASVLEHTQENSGKEYITIRLNGFLSNARFMFFNGKLGFCNLNPPYGSMLYSQSSTDQINSTLRILENYQRWLNDSQVQEMINLLGKVNSVRNATDFSGNLTFKMVVYSPSYVICKFTNTFYDVAYTGLSITLGSIFFFDDSRAYKTIGDTNIYVSKEEAISIAEAYVKNYSTTKSFSNGTKITLSNLNVSGVGPIILSTLVSSSSDSQTEIENTPLSPYWYIQVNVNNVYNLKGVAVSVSATDGKVASSTLVANPYFYFGDPPMGPPFFPNLIFLLSTLFAIFLVAIIVVIVIVVMVTKKPTAKPNR
jgi:hypothetical protein